MKIEYKGYERTFPVLIDLENGTAIQKLTRKASIELEEKLVEVNLRIRMEDGA